MQNNGQPGPKLVTAEEAAQLIKRGDRVVFGVGVEPLELAMAVFSRTLEVGGIRLFVQAPSRDLPQYEPGWEEMFNLEVGYVLPIIQAAVDERRADYVVSGVTVYHEPTEPIDLLITQVSSPDEHGYCGLGASLWNKKKLIRHANVVVAEVNPKLIRTYGDNYIHQSEIDFFVEHASEGGKDPGASDLLGRKSKDALDRSAPVLKTLSEYVSSLVKDGDTLEVGVGVTVEALTRLPTFEDKRDLGWHSENTPAGVVRLVRQGVMTGARKTLHPNKLVATSVGGQSKADFDFIHMNPMFELYSSDYILDPRNIAANDNMVAINGAVSIDLTGQITAESIGSRLIGGTGGQLAFTIGASLSKGGRSIHVMTATVQDGKQSRIVPQLAEGAAVSIPRALADIVVTEYGIARLKGKTQRQRALELAAIAHPDFRAELTQAAKRLF